MNNRKILLIGDSHIHAIKAALKKAVVLPDGFEVEAHRLENEKGGKSIGTLSVAGAARRAAEMGPGDLVVSLIGGNQHSVLGLVTHEVPFAVLGPADTGDALQPGAQLIPRRQIAAYFERTIRKNDARRILAVAETRACPMVHVSSPPPKEDAGFILQRYEANFVALGLAEKGVAPAPLRLRLWEAQNEVLGGLLAGVGVPVLLPPEGTRTAEGFLEPGFYADDATHANTGYGAAVIRQVIDWMTDADQRSTVV